MGNLHPRIFLRSLEDQLRKVKAQYNEAKLEPKYFELSSNELLKNSSMWFLSVVQNIVLESEGITFSAQEFIVDESLSRQKNPPYGLQYPSLVWFMCNLGAERLGYLFGADFSNRLDDIRKEYKINGGEFDV